MYLPERFKCKDEKAVVDLMQANPLATLISVVDGDPLISHLPLVARKNGNDFKLIGHMASGNPHWRHINKSQVTAIFNGANTYITPKWYAENDVPTWNYAVVHCQGSTRLIDDADGILECLRTLTNLAEAKSPDPWQFWIPNDLTRPNDLTAAIIGFEITVTDIKAKFKLSQNRNADDISGVVRGLAARSDDNSRSIRELMLRHK